MAIRIAGDTVIYDDKVFQIGSGTTAERPASPVAGMFRYNTTISSYERYDGANWITVGGPDEFARTVALLGV